MEDAGRRCRWEGPQPLPGRERDGAEQPASGSAALSLDAHHGHAAGSASKRSGAGGSMSRLPEPRLTHAYRLEAALGVPLDVGDVGHGYRRIVPLTDGTFTGPELNGTLVAGV